MLSGNSMPSYNITAQEYSVFHTRTNCPTLQNFLKREKAKDAVPTPK